LTPAASGAETPEPPVLTIPACGVEPPEVLSCAAAVEARAQQSERRRSRFLKFIKHLPVAERKKAVRGRRPSQQSASERRYRGETGGCPRPDLKFSTRVTPLRAAFTATTPPRRHGAGNRETFEE